MSYKIDIEFQRQNTLSKGQRCENGDTPVDIHGPLRMFQTLQ